MPHIHEQRAKELLQRHATRDQNPERRRAHVHMWSAVVVCSVVVIAAYAFITSRTYDFFEVKKSLATAVSQATNFSAKVAPELDTPKMMWTQLQLELTKEANAEVQANVVEQMKKELNK